MSARLEPLPPAARRGVRRVLDLPGRPSGLTLSIVLIALFLLLPIGSVLAHLLLPDQGSWAHISETLLPTYLTNSALLVLAVGIGVPLLGSGTAWLTTLCRFPGARFFAWALVLPLAVPGYVIAYAYTDFFDVAGPLQTWLRATFAWQVGDYWFPAIRSLPGAALLLVLVLYPYVYLLARAAFLEQSVCVLEVGRTLGYRPWRLFLRVALPLARPAIAAGTALALMETLADYGTVSFFGVPTFTTGIVRAFASLGDRVAAAQLAAVLMIAVLGLLLLERWSRSRQRFHHTTGRYRALPHFDLLGWRAGLAILACALPFVLGFLAPAVLLLWMWLERAKGRIDPRFVDWAWNSLSLGLITAVLAVILGLLLAYGLRQRNKPLLGGLARLAGMGYALPGTVVAVGTIIPLVAFDRALSAALASLFDLQVGLLVSGSFVALIYAYLVRFLSISMNTLDASLTKIGPNLDEAARTLGRSPGRVLTEVHAPLLWSGLATAALLVFVDVMKELPATLLLRPFNRDTLAVQAHNLASDERLADAGLPSLAIVAVGILPVLLLSRAIARGRPGL
ncbi:MAG: iron ABC transporter permease [Rhodospirillales bacterium]